MSHPVVCDRCGRPARFELETRPSSEYPGARVFTCECGRVMWQKPQAQQQQQQQPKPKDEDQS
jgi:hypothetical protein